MVPLHDVAGTCSGTLQAALIYMNLGFSRAGCRTPHDTGPNMPSMTAMEIRGVLFSTHGFIHLTSAVSRHFAWRRIWRYGLEIDLRPNAVSLLFACWLDKVEDRLPRVEGILSRVTISCLPIPCQGVYEQL